MNFIKKYAGICFLLVLIAGAYFYHPVSKSQPTLGSAFNPVQGQTYYLSGAGVTNSQNTVQLTSFTTPDGRALVMSDFGSIGYGVIDPNTISRLETISFTGVTQNTNGTATLTGVSRGLDFISPYAASSTLAYSHSGGAPFILSNPAAFYGQQFALLGNAETISGVWTFGSTSPPQYDFNPNFNSLASTTFASIGYVASTSYAGVVNATSLVKGIVQLATGLQAASSTATGSTGALLVLPSSIASDTPSVTQANSKSTVILSNLLGYINQAWLNLSQNWTFTGNVTVPANNTQGGFAPPGAIEAYASTTPPAGWLLANGQGVSTATYPNLFAVIGYAYGGSSGTFDLPNPTGRMLLDASTTLPYAATLGNNGGATTTTLIQANVPSYNLTGTAGNSGGGSSVLAAGGSSGSYSIPSGGSGVPVNVANPYFVIQYIIKY